MTRLTALPQWMRTRRSAVVALASVLTVSGAMLVASPAQAGNVSVSMACDAATVHVTANIGDAITFTFSGDCLTPGGGGDSDMANIVGPHDAADGIGYLGQPISSTGSWSTWGSYGSFGPNDWYGTPGPGPASSVTAVLLGIPPAGANSPINAGVPLTPGDQIASFEVNNGPPAGTTIAIVWDGAPASAPDAQMPAWLQSYGRSASQSCRPGWSPSWAQWAVAATGGSVCNRTVFWNGSAWMQSPSQGWGASDPSQTTAWDGR